MHCLLTWFAHFLAANTLDNNSKSVKTSLMPVLGCCHEGFRRREVLDSSPECLYKCCRTSVTPGLGCRATKDLEHRKFLIQVQCLHINTSLSKDHSMIGQQPMNTPQFYTCADDAHNGHFSGDDAGTMWTVVKWLIWTQELTSVTIPHIASTAQPHLTSFLCHNHVFFLYGDPLKSIFS